MSNSEDNKSLDEFFQLACSLLENQRITKAMEVFEKLLLADYNPSLILPYMIQISMMRNDLNSALNYIDLSLDENPDDIELLTMRASILLQKHRFEDALYVANQILILDSNNDAGIEIKLSALKMLKRFDEMEEFIENSNLESTSLLDENIYEQEDYEMKEDLLDEEFNKFNNMDLSKLKKLNNNSRDNSNGNSQSNTISSDNNIFAGENTFIKPTADEGIHSSNQEEFNNILNGKVKLNEKDLGFISGKDIQNMEGSEKQSTNQEESNNQEEFYDEFDLNDNASIMDNDSHIDSFNENDYKDELDNVPIEELSFQTAFDVKSDNNDNKNMETDSFTANNENIVSEDNNKMEDDLLNDFLSSMDKQIYDDYDVNDEDFTFDESIDDDYDEDTVHSNTSEDNNQQMISKLSNNNLVEDYSDNDFLISNDNHEEDLNRDEFIENQNVEGQIIEDESDKSLELEIEDVSDVPILVDNYNIPEENDLVEKNDSKYDDLNLDDLFDFDEDGNLIEDESEYNNFNLKHFKKNKKNKDDDEDEYDDGIDYGEYHSNQIDDSHNLNEDYLDDFTYEEENNSLENDYDEDIDNSDNSNTSSNKAKINNMEIPLNQSSTLDYYFNFSSGK
ncbi:tetratricopeptide repeat protein [Methanobrevibacter sp.]